MLELGPKHFNGSTPVDLGQHVCFGVLGLRWKHFFWNRSIAVGQEQKKKKKNFKLDNDFISGTRTHRKGPYKKIYGNLASVAGFYTGQEVKCAARKALEIRLADERVHLFQLPMEQLK